MRGDGMTKANSKNCPICKKPPAEKFRPFCSVRCADLDLGSWLGERYRMPVEEGPDEEKAEDSET